jgi:hypothetical protein
MRSQLHAIRKQCTYSKKHDDAVFKDAPDNALITLYGAGFIEYTGGSGLRYFYVVGGIVVMFSFLSNTMRNVFLHLI